MNTPMPSTCYHCGSRYSYTLAEAERHPLSPVFCSANCASEHFGRDNAPLPLPLPRDWRRGIAARRGE